MGKPKNVVAKRPPRLRLESLAQLYLDFEKLFLGGNEREYCFRSACGHHSAVFDHNFFHLVKLNHPQRGKHTPNGRKFKAREEIPRILELTDGFGDYSIDYERAPFLPAAHATFLWPDRIVQRRDLTTATHVFSREYEHPTLPYTVTLVKLENGSYVPVTSFACNRRQINKWVGEVEGTAHILWEKWR